MTGPELVADTDFVNDNGWAFGGDPPPEIRDGAVYFSTNSLDEQIVQRTDPAEPIKPNTWYRVEQVVPSISAGVVRGLVGNFPAPEYAGPGTHVDYIKTGDSPTQILRLEGNLSDAVVDRFSVCEAT